MDHLDALINGLSDAGHIARLKNALVEYKSALDRMPVLEARSSSLKSERSDLLERLSALQARVSEHAASLGVPEDLRQSTSYLMGIGSDQTDQAELQRIAQVRRDVSAAKSQWDSIQQMLTGSAITEASVALRNIPKP